MMYGENYTFLSQKKKEHCLKFDVFYEATVWECFENKNSVRINKL